MKKKSSKSGDAISKPRDKNLLSRPFTLDSDIIILQMLVENNATAKEIANMTGRAEEDVGKRIAYLRRSGRMNKVHKRLMDHKGIYAMKYIKSRQQEGAEESASDYKYSVP